MTTIIGLCRSLRDARSLYEADMPRLICAVEVRADVGSRVLRSAFEFKGIFSLLESARRSATTLPQVSLMRSRLNLIIVIALAAIVVAVLYVTYRLIDPLPPRRFAIAAGAAGSGYDNFARQYARILARHGVELEIRNFAGAVENLDQLRDATSGVQAALTTFGVTQSADANTFYSLGGVFDAAIFIFYRNSEPVTLFSQFRGKRLSIGMPGTALRLAMTEILKATQALDASTQLLDDPDYTRAIDALVAGEIDVVVIPQQDLNRVQDILNIPGVRLMSVAQAEAIAQIIPGLKHVVLWRGLLDLSRDIPNSNVDMLASRNRMLVRKTLHPALQYLLLEAMREVHWPAGAFNRLGEFPAEQPNDLPLSPTAEAFYRSGPTFWQRYTTFWLSSLLNRIAFFIIPVILTLDSPDRLCASHLQMAPRSSHRSIAPRARTSGTGACRRPTHPERQNVSDESPKSKLTSGR